jgi:Ca-activated chloride channel homolog
VNIIPQGGTAIGEAIATARAAFKEKNENYKVLVVFTDGEDHDGQALELARDAAKEGIRIFTVGVGTPNGELLRVSDGKGRTDYVRDEQGNVVKSRLNEKVLQEIAQAGNGFYMLLAGANTMDLLYERGLAPLPKGELSARHVRRYHERYQWFLGAALLLLLAEMFLPERRRVRRTEAILAASANAELRKAVATLMALAIPVLATASAGQALKQYQAGRYGAAQRKYEQLLEERPNDPRVRFNAGTAAFQAQNYQRAIEHLNSALATQDLELQQRAYYNRGNAEFRLGEETSDPKGKMAEWESAVGSFESALKLNPNDADAKHNLEFVKEKLEELKKQQQQQQQNKDDSQKKDEQQQKQDQQKQDQQKQDQQKQDQQKGDQQQQQQQQDQSKPKEEQQPQANKPENKKQDQQNAQSQPANKDDQGKDPQQAGQQMRPMQMTPQQAQQLLDAQKSEERAMIFIPQLRTNRSDRVLKNW